MIKLNQYRRVKKKKGSSILETKLVLTRPKMVSENKKVGFFGGYLVALFYNYPTFFITF